MESEGEGEGIERKRGGDHDTIYWSGDVDNIISSLVEVKGKGKGDGRSGRKA